MKLEMDRPVNIVIIGAGGTGGYVIPHLYRIAYASERDIRIVIADGDTVEKKNLIRQNFAGNDVGKNKANVMAARYSGVFGIETEYVPEYIEDEERLRELLSTKTGSGDVEPIGILIGAVDNNRSRIICNNVFNAMDNLIYIDSGNGEFTGQVVCGAKRYGRVVSKPAARIYPDILTDIEKFPSELSCAEHSISAPQSIAANVMASAAIVSMLYYLLIEGNLQNMRVAFSARKNLMKKIA